MSSRYTRLFPVLLCAIVPCATPFRNLYITVSHLVTLVKYNLCEMMSHTVSTCLTQTPVRQTYVRLPFRAVGCLALLRSRLACCTLLIANGATHITIIATNIRLFPKLLSIPHPLHSLSCVAHDSKHKSMRRLSGHNKPRNCVGRIIARPISLTQTRLATRQGQTRNDFLIGLALPRWHHRILR
jgi:hypothetical protein